MSEQWWTFTFGMGHPLFAGMYIDIFGTYTSARETMFEVFRNKWSRQYGSHEEAGVEEFELQEIRTSLRNLEEKRRISED
jgi:hypothetical protein